MTDSEGKGTSAFVVKRVAIELHRCYLMGFQDEYSRAILLENFGASCEKICLAEVRQGQTENGQSYFVGQVQCLVCKQLA